MNFGFIKVAAAVPQVTVANCIKNAQEIKTLIVEAENQGIQVVTFPELSLTGYTCGDLFMQDALLRNARKALANIADYTKGMEIIAIIGLPIEHRSRLYNAAAVVHNGHIIGITAKAYLSCHQGGNEKRWFTPAPVHTEIQQELWIDNPLREEPIPFSSQQIYTTPSFRFSIEIGDDLWSVAPPSTNHCLQGADIIFHLAADRGSIGMSSSVKERISHHSAQCLCGYVHASSGYGESTTDYVYPGHALICDQGELIAEGEPFSLTHQLIDSEIDIESLRAKRRASGLFADAASASHSPRHQYIALDIKRSRKRILLTRHISPAPFIPQAEKMDEYYNDLFQIQVTGLCRRIEHTHSQTVIIGISGGLDSTLALLVCAKAFDKLDRSRKEIIGITMPGFGTTDRTYHNALGLMNSLGITIREISIKDACLQHFSDIGHDASLHNVTYENSQARERTQILMDVANQANGMVIGTGDLSELALGWATYNGDHMSMYGVNASVPKTLIQSLVGWIADHAFFDDDSADILHDIIDTPISPELIPADEQGHIKQKTEDLVGPYELHDFFLYHFMHHHARPKKIFYLAQLAFAGKYTDDTIKKWLTTFCRRFFNQQFKRSCLPDGPAVSHISLSPRGSWLMPSDAHSTEWLNECEEL